MAISPIDSPPPPMTSAVKAIQQAHRMVAEVARDVAEHGTEGLAENVVKLTTAEIAAKAAAEVVRTAAELDDELIDILA
jgi:hypothetical protein